MAYVLSLVEYKSCRRWRGACNRWPPHSRRIIAEVSEKLPGRASVGQRPPPALSHGPEGLPASVDLLARHSLGSLQPRRARTVCRNGTVHAFRAAAGEGAPCMALSNASRNARKRTARARSQSSPSPLSPLSNRAAPCHARLQSLWLVLCCKGQTRQHRLRRTTQSRDGSGRARSRGVRKTPSPSGSRPSTRQHSHTGAH